jgi:2-methylcitrate dehydratase PrpD
VEALAYKPYPCGIVIRPALDAALAWHRAHGAQASSITRVQLQAQPSALALGFRRHPAGALEAKVSLYHWVASALATGRAGVAVTGQDSIDDPTLVALRDLIEVESNAALTTEAAVLTVTLANGQQDTLTVDMCKGSVANPMSDADLAEKFHGQAQLRLSPEQATRLLAHCWQVDKLGDAATLAQLARMA